MGGQWGVNRSVAQIHALLYLSEQPLTAEEIADTLRLARSNVSNSIKELLAWKLIRRVPVMGDRRDHFEAEIDIWEMVTRIAQGRKEGLHGRRQIRPADQPGGAEAAVQHAGFRRDDQPLVRTDAWRAEGQAGRAHQDGGADRDLHRFRQEKIDRAPVFFWKFISFNTEITDLTKIG
jgi:hypothetical protein